MRSKRRNLRTQFILSLTALLCVAFSAAAQRTSGSASPDQVNGSRYNASTPADGGGTQSLMTVSKGDTSLTVTRSNHFESLLLFLMGAILFSISTAVRLVNARKRNDPTSERREHVSVRHLVSMK